MAQGAKQGSGCGLLSPRRSESKQVNQVQLNKHALSKRKFPVQSASFHFTAGVHLECHCICCGHPHDDRTQDSQYRYPQLFECLKTRVFWWYAHLACKTTPRRPTSCICFTQQQGFKSKARRFKLLRGHNSSILCLNYLSPQQTKGRLCRVIFYARMYTYTHTAHTYTRTYGRSRTHWRWYDSSLGC